MDVNITKRKKRLKWGVEGMKEKRKRMIE